MNAQLHCKIFILPGSTSNNIFTVQLFKPRQITSTAGQKTSHNSVSQVITPGTSVLWQSHAGTALAQQVFPERWSPALPVWVSCWSFQLPSWVSLPVWVSSKPGKINFSLSLHVPGPRLSSYHENTNQWLTEMVITKRFLATLLFPQTLILHQNSHLFPMHACTLGKLWKYNFITMDLPQSAKLSQKSIQVCWQKAKC